MNTTIPLKHAPQPFEFFQTHFMYKGPTRKNNSRRFWKSEWSPVRKSAGNSNWFKELNKLGEESRWAFIFRTALDDNPELIKHIDWDIASHSAKSTKTLICIDGFKKGLERSLPESSCHSFLDFLLSQGDRELDAIEVCYWMLFSYNEIALRLSSLKTDSSAISDPDKLMFPPQCWIPSVKDNGLVSTRFQIVDHLRKNFTCKTTESQTKSLKRARTNGKVVTEQVITKNTPLPNAIKPEGVYSAIIESVYPNGRPDSSIQNEVKEYVYMMLRFASYFGYVQIQQLRNGSSPSNIVKSFERYHSIRQEFNEAQSLFYDGKSER